MIANALPGAIVVFGATGSVGCCLSHQMREQGRHLLVAGRNEERLEQIAYEIDAPFAIVDAADSGSVDAAVDKARSEFGTVSGVANCMGSLLLKPAHSTTDEQWQEIIEANLFSSFAVVRSAAKTMPSGGAIALVSSAAASQGFANHEAIAAAKAGVEGLVRSAAATYASRGIRVNAVAPGLVKSEMTRPLWQSEATAASSVAMHPLGRLGEPEDIASALAWLLSEHNNWITGQVIGVDGGLSRVLPRRVVRR